MSKLAYLPHELSDDDRAALDDAQAIKNGLRTHDRVSIQCFNEQEVADIRKFLTEEERRRVSFKIIQWREQR